MVHSVFKQDIGKPLIQDSYWIQETMCFTWQDEQERCKWYGYHSDGWHATWCAHKGDHLGGSW